MAAVAAAVAAAATAAAAAAATAAAAAVVLPPPLRCRRLRLLDRTIYIANTNTTGLKNQHDHTKPVEMCNDLQCALQC